MRDPKQSRRPFDAFCNVDIRLAAIGLEEPEGLGAAVAFGSTVGVLLTPIWAAAFWLHALIEEEALKSKYGASYEAYMARVRSRLIPGLPL